MTRHETMVMSRRLLLAGIGGSALAGCVTDDVGGFGGVLSGGGALTEAEAAAGIRAALNNGVASAISTGVLRTPDGNAVHDRPSMPGRAPAPPV